MLAYAAGRQNIAARHSSPSTMLLIVGGHVAAVALAMSLKMVIDQKEKARPTQVILVDPEPVPTPPPPKAQSQPDQQVPRSDPYQPPTIVPLPPVGNNPVATVPIPQPSPPSIVGNDPPTPPTLLPLPQADPVRVGPRLATPPSALRPPYPASKLDSGEEAALRLRLSIDERGRVTAVEPVGTADAAFLASARRHLMAKWRYQPATVDGRPIATSTVITLRFQLEG